MTVLGSGAEVATQGPRIWTSLSVQKGMAATCDSEDMRKGVKVGKIGGHQSYKSEYTGLLDWPIGLKGILWGTGPHLAVSRTSRTAELIDAAHPPKGKIVWNLSNSVGADHLSIRQHPAGD